MKRLPFDLEEKPPFSNLKQWSYNVKVISSSREPKLIPYLKSFLDDTTEFVIEDGSKYRYVGVLRKGEKYQPDLVTVRVCDVAFVALLRMYNQFVFEPQARDLNYYLSCAIKKEILSKEITDFIRSDYTTNNVNLYLFEKFIKLTPELRKKIK